MMDDQEFDALLDLEDILLKTTQDDCDDRSQNASPPTKRQRFASDASNGECVELHKLDAKGPNNGFDNIESTSNDNLRLGEDAHSELQLRRVPLRSVEDSRIQSHRPPKFMHMLTESEFDSLPLNTAEEKKGPSLLDRNADTLIDRILQARVTAERNRYLESVSAASALSRSHLDDKEERSYCFGQVFRFPPAKPCWTGVTSPTGQRLYIGMQTSAASHASSCLNATSFGAMQLLSKPFAQLIGEAEEAESRRLAHAVMATSTIDENPERKCQQGLWVDKYKPKCYTDLLSDEGVNRTLITWLKLWDKCVFGRSKRQRQDALKRATQPDHRKGNKKQLQVDADELPTELDQFLRPQHKIALLCGPPGLGKTTLANVIAHHVGYHVIEVNASDDRSIEKVRQVIETSTQVRTTLDANPRPICVILDEIDGAPPATVAYLLSLVSKDDTTGERKRRPMLKRPLIAICNDLYTPALKELRKVGLVLHFPLTDSAQLIDRLFQICLQENYPVEKSALAVLARESSEDIRFCINAVQYLHSLDAVLSTEAVHKMTASQKDAHNTLFMVWSQTFALPRDRNSRSNGRNLAATSGDDESSMSFRFRRMMAVAHACGEDEKVRMGLFENYLNAKFKDMDMMTVVCGMEWYGFVDMVAAFIGSHLAFELLPYQPFLVVIFHLLFASPTPTKLQYLSAGYEYEAKQRRLQDVVQSLCKRPHIHATEVAISACTLVLDVLPLLYVLLQPSFRPVSVQLFSAKEKAELKRVVDVMLTFNLTYRQQRTADGQFAFVLDPPLDEATKFVGTCVVRPIAQTTKQLIAREIELELVRKLNEAKLSSDGAKTKTPKTPVGEIQPATAVATPALAVPRRLGVPIHLRNMKQLTDTDAVKVEKPVTDFFGRVISTPAVSTVQGKVMKDAQTGFWFKHNTGCNNAVRRNIRIKDLM